MDVYRGGRELGGSWAPPDGRGGSGCVGVTAHARSHQPLARSPQLARRPAYGEFCKTNVKVSLTFHIFIYVYIPPQCDQDAKCILIH